MNQRYIITLYITNLNPFLINEFNFLIFKKTIYMTKIHIYNFCFILAFNRLFAICANSYFKKR